jgi:hypothetical protein
MKLKRFESDNINESRKPIIKKTNEELEKIEIINRLSENWSNKLNIDYLVPKSLKFYSLEELKEIEKIYISESVEENMEDVKLPKIFTYTKYDLPSVEDLKEIDECHLNTEQIINGFGYTIIGRGIKTLEKERKIYDSVKMLSEYFPENMEYIKVLNTVKEKYNIQDEVVESCSIDDKKCTICETLKELKDLHMNNEAVENIYVEDGEIVFDCKCETDIQGTTEYNGFTLRFNKICELKNTEDVKEEMTEEQIIEHAKMINEKVMNEYLTEMGEEEILEHARIINEKVMNEYLSEIKKYNEN